MYVSEFEMAPYIIELHFLSQQCEGTPCLEKTWRMNSLASMGDVMVSTVGIKIDCLVRWSMMTSIVLEC